MLADFLDDFRPLKRTHSVPSAARLVPNPRPRFPAALADVLSCTRCPLPDGIIPTTLKRAGGKRGKGERSGSGAVYAADSPLVSAGRKWKEDQEASLNNSGTSSPLCHSFGGSTSSALWALSWRSCRSAVPPGIKSFAEEMKPFLRKHQSPKPASSVPWTGHSKESSVARGGGNGLQWMEKWGETHASSAIPLATSHRERGIFGAAKKKELHQLVVSILNKVTTDPEKFLSVRNDLLRLPIPEASHESLQMVIKVFLNKAIAETHFSHLYAKLMQCLCVGPNAVSTLASSPNASPCASPPLSSLEVRVGKAIVELCLREFQTLVDQTGNEQIQEVVSNSPGHSRSPSTEGLAKTVPSAPAVMSEEKMKAMRERLCGTVRFALELYTIHFIGDEAITDILYTCCTGSVNGKIVTPPTYSPSEAQMGALMAMINFESGYFESEVWTKEIRPVIVPWLQYWREHFPVPRICFLLINTVEKIVGKSAEVPASAAISSSPSIPAVQELRTPAPAVAANSGMAFGILQEYPASLVSLPNAKAVASLMSLCSREHLRLETLVMDILRQCPTHMIAVIKGWTTRSLTVVKETWAREHVGELLQLTVRHASSFPTLSQEAIAKSMREIVQEKFNERCFEEVQGFFKFFAAVVLSDQVDVIMTENWLTDGIGWVAALAQQDTEDEDEDNPLALYLTDVCKAYHQHRCQQPASVSIEIINPNLSGETFQSSSSFSCSWGEKTVPDTPPPRFRPLLSLLSHYPTLQEWAELPEDTRQEIASTSIELLVFERLVHAEVPNGAACAMEALFEELRTSPRTAASDTTLAAEVMTGILVAEHYCRGADFLNDGAALLQVAVDQPQRYECELLLMKEVMLIARRLSTAKPTLGLRVMDALLHGEVVSPEVYDIFESTYITPQASQQSTFTFRPSALPGPSQRLDAPLGVGGAEQGGVPPIPANYNPSNPNSSGDINAYNNITFNNTGTMNTNNNNNNNNSFTAPYTHPSDLSSLRNSSFTNSHIDTTPFQSGGSLHNTPMRHNHTFQPPMPPQNPMVFNGPPYNTNAYYLSQQPTFHGGGGGGGGGYRPSSGNASYSYGGGNPSYNVSPGPGIAAPPGPMGPSGGGGGAYGGSMQQPNNYGRPVYNSKGPGRFHSSAGGGGGHFFQHPNNSVYSAHAYSTSNTSHNTATATTASASNGVEYTCGNADQRQQNPQSFSDHP